MEEVERRRPDGGMSEAGVDEGGQPGRKAVTAHLAQHCREGVHVAGRVGSADPAAESGETEVADPDDAVVSEQDAVGMEGAMHDAARVGVSQTGRQMRCEPDRFVGGDLGVPL